MSKPVREGKDWMHKQTLGLIKQTMRNATPSERSEYRATLHKLLDKSTQNREDYQTNIQKMESMLKRTRQLIQEVREKAIKGRAENERLSMQVREKLRVVERVMREYGEMGAEEERRREIGR